MKKQVMDFSNIEKFIVTVRGQRVIIDNDVANIYGVLTKEVNQAVKNNPEKFPPGYILKLTDEETNSLCSKKLTLNKPGRGQHSKFNPTIFTLRGLYMFATILKSPKATEVTVSIIEAFANLRELAYAIANLGNTKEKPEQQSLNGTVQSSKKILVKNEEANK